MADEPLEFMDWEVDGVVVLTLTGRLVLGPSVTRLRDTLRELIERDKLNILLNMKEVLHIDSSGLGELVTAYTTLKRRGGKLKLLKLNARGESLMQLTKLYTVFEVFTDEDEAVRSFNPQAEEAPAATPQP